MSNRWKIAAAVCLFALAAGLAAAEPADATFDLADGAADITADGVYAIVQTGVEEGPTANGITVAPGVAAELVLGGVWITNASQQAALEMAGADVTLVLEGTNTLVGGRGAAGIHVPARAELRVCGDGALSATGGFGAAGIGGKGNEGAGTVVFESGTVTAGSESGPGIGGGRNGGAGGIVTITGGRVTATGNGASAGIGGGCGTGTGGAGGTVEISGGEVLAEGGSNGAGIGGANKARGGTVRISGGTVTAIGGAGGAGIGGGAGMGGNGGVFEMTGGTVTAIPGESVAGAAAVGGGSMGDGGTVSICGGSLMGTPIGVYGTNKWTVGGPDNGAAGGGVRVWAVEMPKGRYELAVTNALPYTYVYDGDGHEGSDSLWFYLPAGKYAFHKEGVPWMAQVGEDGVAKVAIAEIEIVSIDVAADGTVSLAWTPADYPGAVAEQSPELGTNAVWSAFEERPGSMRLFYRIHVPE
jgi:hypothetical protein